MKFISSRLLLCLIVSIACAVGQEVTEVETSVSESTEAAEPVNHSNADDAAATDEPLQQEQVQEQSDSPQTSDDVTAEMSAQSGPFIDLFGPTLLSLEMTSATTAQLNEMSTNQALQGKKVIGLYFSADWCGPCRQFTPELVNFYEKVNKRRKQDFQIVWVSRCRDVQSYGQYFTEMKWLALPPQEAMGERGQWLGEKYGVKSIPYLVLLDEAGNVITKDARSQIPKDKAGIGFPWRNPLSTLYITLVPKTLRHIIKSNVASVKDQVFKRIQTVFRPTKKAAA